MLPIIVKLELKIDVEGGRADLRVLPTNDNGVDSPSGSLTATPTGDSFEEAVRRLAPRSQLAFELDYLRRCVAELGAEIRPPATGARPYLNVYPPAGYRRRRLAAIQLSTGRIHCELPPDVSDRWPDAEVVTVNGEPDYLRIYLQGAEHVHQAVDMARAALEMRG